MKRQLCFALAAGVLSAAPAMGSVLNSGDTVGGFRITFSGGITLLDDGISSDGSTLFLSKTTSFTSNEGEIITFTQTGHPAVTQIQIDNDAITNDTGAPLGGVQYLLAATLPAGGIPTFANGFSSTGTFTDSTLTQQVYTVTGGVLGAGESTTLTGKTDLVFNSEPAGGTQAAVVNIKTVPVPEPVMGAALLMAPALLVKRRARRFVRR